MAYLAMDSNLVPSASCVFQLFACAARLDQYRALSGNLFFLLILCIFPLILHTIVAYCKNLAKGEINAYGW